LFENSSRYFLNTRLAFGYSLLKCRTKQIPVWKQEITVEKAMTVHDWLLCLTIIGEIIGIFGSIALNKEAIMTGLIIGVGSLFTDTLLQRKEGLQE
jgi:hypothetical protein